jgi:hypothetical protein
LEGKGAGLLDGGKLAVFVILAAPYEFSPFYVYLSHEFVPYILYIVKVYIFE